MLVPTDHAYKPCSLYVAFPLLVEYEKARAMPMLAEMLHAGHRPHFQDILCFRFRRFFLLYMVFLAEPVWSLVCTCTFYF